MKTFLRILIIGGILLILVFLSIGIVRVVPKALSSLASASLSIGSVFNEAPAATSTTSTYSTSTSSMNGGQEGQGGFIVSSSTSETSGTSTRSLSSIMSPHAGDYPPNNYVPAPGTNMSTYGKNGAYSTTRYGAPGVYRQTCMAGGAPDLAVTVLSQGVINSAGQYVTTNTFTTADSASIKFKVENRGDCPSGPWTLTTRLPSSNTADQARSVANAPSLPAGSAVEGVANFTSPQAGNVTATISAAANSGQDTNPSNNTAATVLSVVSSGSTYAGGGTYPYGYGGNGTVPVIGDGRPDLLVQIVQTGTLDYNNNFIPMSGSSIPANGRVAVKFTVINDGAAPTGLWNLQATLTGSSGQKFYNSPSYQGSIPAGGTATYTIGFDNLSPGSNTITIMVDSTNQVNEFNEGNNTASFSFQAY